MSNSMDEKKNVLEKCGLKIPLIVVVQDMLAKKRKYIEQILKRSWHLYARFTRKKRKHSFRRKEENDTDIIKTFELEKTRS